MPTKTPKLDILARKVRHLFHHLTHFRDCFLQNFCLFADDILCNLVRKKQNALQPIQKVRWHLVVFVLLLQELKGRALPLCLFKTGEHEPQT